MRGWQYDWATVQVLWRRDVLRFGRQPARILGALGQPIIFWLVIGGGMAATFRLPGQSPIHAMDYREFFYPGVVIMVGLFASIFASVSLIDDRHQGFLQSVLAGPGSRGALVSGKCLGSASIALLQITAFLFLAPLAGFRFGLVNWAALMLALGATTLGLSALGFAVAWWLDNVQAYHAVQMTLLMPLWVVSGSMFPAASDVPAFAWAMACNPVAYAVTAVRHALYGGMAPPGTALPVPLNQALAVVAVFAVVAWLLALLACRRPS